MKLTKILLSTTAILLATSALAADLPTTKTPPAPTLAVAPYSWTGFYVGAGGGGAWMRAHDSSYSTYTNGPVAPLGGSNRSDLGKFGAFGTIEAGADYQMDRFVVGAFTNFDFKSLKKTKSITSKGTYTTTTSSTGTSSYNYTARHSVWYKVGNNWDAGVRLGYLVTDRNLVYALGGYSGAQVSSGVRLDVSYGSGGNSAAASESGWKSGYMVGAGWENALTDHISFKLEYRYADYGKAKSSYNTGSGVGWQSGDVSVQSVRAVLDYKF
jgi:outer membrane immunogenic protein